MKIPLLALAALALAAAAPSAAADSHCNSVEGCPCPEYDKAVTVGDDSTLVFEYNDDLQWQASVLGQLYVAGDELASNGYIFSVWLGVEANGEPGWQRWDEYCQGPDDPSNADVLLP